MKFEWIYVSHSSCGNWLSNLISILIWSWARFLSSPPVDIASNVDSLSVVSTLRTCKTSNHNRKWIQRRKKRFKLFKCAKPRTDQLSVSISRIVYPILSSSSLFTNRPHFIVLVHAKLVFTKCLSFLSRSLSLLLRRSKDFTKKETGIVT